MFATDTIGRRRVLAPSYNSQITTGEMLEVWLNPDETVGKLGDLIDHVERVGDRFGNLVTKYTPVAERVAGKIASVAGKVAPLIGDVPV